MLKGNIATSPEAQAAAAEEGRQYGALIASSIIETFGADLPENQTDQVAIIQAALANYVEILRAGEIHPALISIAVKNASEVCSSRFLDLPEFFLRSGFKRAVLCALGIRRNKSFRNAREHRNRSFRARERVGNCPRDYAWRRPGCATTPIERRTSGRIK
jgi:hypothetical protein